MESGIYLKIGVTEIGWARTWMHLDSFLFNYLKQWSYWRMNVLSLLIWLCMQLSGAFPKNKMIVMSVVVSHLFWWFLHVCYENLGLDLITELHTVHKLAEICLSLIFSFLGGSWFWLLIFHLFVCYTEFKMQNFIYVFFPQIIAAVLYVQIFKLYKTQKFFKKHFFYLNCFVT